MVRERPVSVQFFRLDSGREPVREWLKGMSREHRKAIGEDVKTLQFGWPIGMPLARKKTPANELMLAKRRLNKLRS